VILQDLLDELHCPYCGSGLQQEAQVSLGSSENRYGIVRCACYRYPIIEGILILKQLSGPADIRDKGVQYIEAGDSEGALHYALNCMSPIPLPRRTHLQGIVDFLGRRSSSFARKLAPLEQGQAVRRVCDGSLTFQQVLSLLRPGPYAHYLFHRYANNSFLASIAILLLLKELNGESYTPGQPLGDESGTSTGNKKTSWVNQRRPTGTRRVLDLACGVGHASFLMTSLFPHLSVVAADHDFVNLYIARRYLIPDVTCVCVDAEIPLPFADNSFDAVFCLDGFHYIRSKVALLSELDRILHPLGLWLFPHLHNALANNISAGIPLAYEDYLRCFEFIQPRILSEAEVFRNLMNDQSLDLDVVPSAAELRRASVFSLIASRRTDLWRKHSSIASILWHDKPPLSINPIYQVINQGKTMRLRMKWPDASLEEECAPIKNYLPLECEVDRSLLERLKSGMMTEEDEFVIQELLKSFVLVRLPREYGEFV